MSIRKFPSDSTSSLPTLSLTIPPYPPPPTPSPSYQTSSIHLPTLPFSPHSLRTPSPTPTLPHDIPYVVKNFRSHWLAGTFKLSHSHTHTQTHVCFGLLIFLSYIATNFLCQCGQRRHTRQSPHIAGFDAL